MTLPRPAYGTGSLSEVLPSVLASLGVEAPDALALPPTDAAVVLLVDGLGLALLERHAARAPFLASLARRTLTCGFPSTTAVSLASFGTGLPPGAHGITGYTSAVPEAGEVVSWLTWSGASGDLRDRLVPERAQPRRTAFQQAEDAGVTVTLAAPSAFEGSGLTRAALRGGTFAGTVSAGDVVARAAAAATGPGRRLVYGYTPDLDLTGHVRGVDSEAWRAQLSLVDALAAGLAERLPAGAVLHVVADHGMVDVPDAARVDVDAEPELQQGVRALAGEPRARHVHVHPGALEDVHAAWTARLGDRAAVLHRDEAVAAGLLGPEPGPAALERTGDLVVLATGDLAVVRGTAEPMITSLRGQHGALTDDELLVPLLSHLA